MFVRVLLSTHFTVQTDLPEAQGKNWKLMLDPFLKAKGQGHAKVIRYGGRLEGPDVSSTVFYV